MCISSAEFYKSYQPSDSDLKLLSHKAWTILLTVNVILSWEILNPILKSFYLQQWPFENISLYCLGMELLVFNIKRVKYFNTHMKIQVLLRCWFNMIKLPVSLEPDSTAPYFACSIHSSYTYIGKQDSFKGCIQKFANPHVHSFSAIIQILTFSSRQVTK